MKKRVSFTNPSLFLNYILKSYLKINNIKLIQNDETDFFIKKKKQLLGMVTS